ncbi:hypothetical protein LCGC14_1220100 [marine sediment metagenome]|uniref:Uncharacterized protein n=1 Tax=marine sediment metagenome TaxID=412755 RepID=A0A0F9LBL5_9ZZZZ
MSARKKITQVSITTTGSYSGNLAQYCPFTSGTTDMNNWFDRFISQLFGTPRGGDIKMYTNTAYTEYILIDRGLITAVTVTLS